MSCFNKQCQYFDKKCEENCSAPDDYSNSDKCIPIEKEYTIYEFITPSDPITFIAPDDKIAYFCAIMLGEGKAGCTRNDENNNEINLRTLMFGFSEPIKIIESYLGCTLDKFKNDNKQQIADCFKSFAYGHIEDRETFDDALKAITEPEKLKEFKNKHDERNRTSVSKWVKYAWEIGEKMSNE